MQFKLLLLCVCIVLPRSYAQLLNNFDRIPSVSAMYQDRGSAQQAHLLRNNPNQAKVSAPSKGRRLGFKTYFTPTRQAPNNKGLSNMQFFGILSDSLVRQLMIGTPQNQKGCYRGNQCFVGGGVEGRVTLVFDPVDLTGTSTPQFSAAFWLAQTTYENSHGSNDRLYARIEIDGGQVAVIPVIDTDGGGTGGGNGGQINNYRVFGNPLTGRWTRLYTDLSYYIGHTAQFIVEFDADEGSEGFGLDEILFSEGQAEHLLPSALNSFAVRGQERGVRLQWDVGAVHTTEYFQIERSQNAIHFEPIGAIQTVSTQQLYEFIDEDPEPGAAYYRLAMHDIAGGVEYSPIVSYTTAWIMDYEIYPNPTTDALSLILPEALAVPHEVECINVLGQVVRRMYLKEGQRRHKLSLQGLAKGLYYLRDGQGEVFSSAVPIQKY